MTGAVRRRSGRPRRGNLSARIYDLEVALLDPMNLVPHTQQWLDYWYGQIRLYVTRQDPHAIDDCPVDALCLWTRGVETIPNGKTQKRGAV